MCPLIDACKNPPLIAAHILGLLNSLFPVFFVFPFCIFCDLRQTMVTAELRFGMLVAPGYVFTDLTWFRFGISD